MEYYVESCWLACFGGNCVLLIGSRWRWFSFYLYICFVEPKDKSVKVRLVVYVNIFRGRSFLDSPRKLAPNRLWCTYFGSMCYYWGTLRQVLMCPVCLFYCWIGSVMFAFDNNLNFVCFCSRSSHYYCFMIR